MQREFGRYRLLRHLATGGMGEVYLAEAVGAAGFAKRVVIKTLRGDLAADQDLVRQFVAEGQLLEALDHPNIAQILDLGLADHTYFLAMEFVEGFDLRALLRALPTRDGAQRLGEAAALYVLACVARALDHAQTRRGPDGRALAIVHHDVTPSNIMVRRDGHTKLVDFGVARSALLHRLSAGALRGKLPYLSPEHARQEPVDGRADLFSLGLVACEMLTGQRGLEVAEPEALEDAYARLPGRIEALRAAGTVGPATVDLVADLVQLEPARRPASARDVADRAEQLLAGLGEASPTRTLAADLEPAFEQLEARAGSFDQALAQTLGLSGELPAAEKTGTVSLPGLDVVHIAAASALDGLRQEAAAEPLPQATARPRRRGFKRMITAILAGLALATSLGFWFGSKAVTPAEGALAGVGVPAAPRPQGAGPAVAAARLPGAAPVLAPAARSGAVAPPVVATPGVPPGPVAPREARSPGAGGPVAVPGGPAAAPSALPAGATAAQVEAHAGPGADTDDTNPPRKPRDTERLATIEFLVLPSNAVVEVDGRRVRPAEANRYRLELKPGSHRITARDPALPDGVPAVEVVRDLREGEHRVLKGFQLGKDI